MSMIMRGVVDQMEYQGFGILAFMKVKTMDGLVLLTQLLNTKAKLYQEILKQVMVLTIINGLIQVLQKMNMEEKEQGL